MNPHVLEVFMGGGPRVALESRDVNNVVTSRIIAPSCFAGITFSQENQRYIVATGGEANYHVWYPFGAVPSNTYWIGWEWSNASGTVTQGPFPTPITGGTPRSMPTSTNFYVQQQGEYGQWTGQLDLYLYTDSTGQTTVSQSTHQITCNTVFAGIALSSFNRFNTITNGSCYSGANVDAGTMGFIRNTGGVTTNYYWYTPGETVPASTYWIRGTFTNETNVDAKNPAGAPTWQALPADLDFWIRTDSAGDTASATLTLELATDSSGSTIISTSTHSLSAFSQNGL